MIDKGHNNGLIKMNRAKRGENMKALIVIDYSYDFVADDGALTVGAPAQALSQHICDLTHDFLNASEYVVIANDTHHKGDPYHPETKLFPPHNIEGTPGQKLYGEMQTILEANKDNPNLYYLSLIHI